MAAIDRPADELFVLCSACFKDHGLRLESLRQAIVSAERCVHCGSSEGRKLDRSAVENLAHRFFVSGSVFKTRYGAAPVIQCNAYHHGKGDVEFEGDLAEDARLIEDVLKVGFFLYGPRTWMVGEIEPLNDLQDAAKQASVIQRVIDEYPTRSLEPSEIFYRLRRNPKRCREAREYDAPPDELCGGGRLDAPGQPVLYGSQDFEICIHECRVTIADQLYMGILRPTRSLRLLDLTTTIREQVLEWESLNLAIHMLFRAEEHAYDLGRLIARAAREAGYDGLAYPSYFSQVREGTIPNVAIFGRPLAAGLIALQSVNRVQLRGAAYDTRLGPPL